MWENLMKSMFPNMHRLPKNFFRVLFKIIFLLLFAMFICLGLIWLCQWIAGQ